MKKSFYAVMLIALMAMAMTIGCKKQAEEPAATDQPAVEQPAAEQPAAEQPAK